MATFLIIEITFSAVILKVDATFKKATAMSANLLIYNSSKRFSYKDLKTNFLKGGQFTNLKY